VKTTDKTSSKNKLPTKLPNGKYFIGLSAVNFIFSIITANKKSMASAPT
jgi:hypothetical protein